MFEPVHISASQIQTAKLCWRKWAWVYIAGEPKRETAAKALGSKVHELLEAYMLSGTPPNPTEPWQFKDEGKVYFPGKIAINMINEHLPAPGDAFVELEFKDEIEQGFFIVGKIDLNWMGAQGTAHLLDHKTSSDPIKWGKKPSELENDVQRIIYSAHLARVYPDAEKIQATWNYGSTKGIKKHSYVSNYWDTAENVLKKFDNEIIPFAAQMVDIKRKQIHPLELPFNADACGVFGGCPHKSLCGLTSRERLGALFMSNNKIDDLLQQAKNKMGKGKAKEEAQTDPINPPEGASEGEGATPAVVKPPVNKLPVVTAKKGTRKSAAKPKADPQPTAQAEPAVKKELPVTVDVTMRTNVGDAATDQLIERIVDRVIARLAQRLG